MLPRIAFFLLLLPHLLSAADTVFTAGSDWEVVSNGHQFAEGMAWDADGHFYFTDVPRGQLFKIERSSNAKTLIDGATGKANGIAFGPDGRLYGCASGDKSIYAWDPQTWQKVAVTQGTLSNDIAILRDGTIFYTEPIAQKVWRLAARSFEREVAAPLDWKPNGIALSLDEKSLLVAEFDAGTIHGYAIGDDSKLTGAVHPAYKLAVPSDGSGKLDGMKVLADGRLLAGTALGTQLAPPFGALDGSAVLMIIPSPPGRTRCNYARISPDGTWLYTAYTVEILRRRLRPEFAQPRR